MSPFDGFLDKFLGDGPKKMDGASDQPSEDLKLCSFVKSYFEDVRNQANRVSSEGIWMTNIAALLGYDNVFYDTSTRQFRPSNVGTPFLNRSRLRANLLLPAAQSRLSRMLKNAPRYDIRPNSLDETDKEAAQLGMDVINDVWDRQNINRKRIDLGMWLQECGHAYAKISYDDTMGDPMVDPISGELIGFEGDERIDICSAFECFPDPLAKTFEECGKFGQAKVRKLEYFREHYPERGELVKEEGAWLLSAQYEMRINTLNTVGPMSSGTAEQMKNAAIELSYYEKRSKKYPRGRHIVVANGVLLKNDELPYGEIPFAKFDDIVVGGKFYSESVITHSRPLQEQYNRLLNKRAEWTNKLLAGKVIAAKGHGLMPQSLNNRTEVVEYDPVPNAAEPKAMDMPVMPSYAYSEGDSIKKDLYEIFGSSEVSRGQLPSASIPAKGLEILLEADETRLGIEVEQHEHSWARVGQLILKCAAKNYVMERKLKKKNKNGGYDIRSYTGADLRNNFDVTVIRGSTLPNNKVVKRQEILNLYGQGLMGNPQDPATQEQLLGILEYGEIGEVWRDYHLDMQQIKKTISEIEMEIVPEVNRLDNQALHIIEKNRYRKSEKFDSLSDISKAILEQDIQARIEAGAALANPQLQVPPPEPTPPPPMDMSEPLNQQGEALGLPMQATG